MAHQSDEFRISEPCSPQQRFKTPRRPLEEKIPVEDISHDRALIVMASLRTVKPGWCGVSNLALIFALFASESDCAAPTTDDSVGPREEVSWKTVWSAALRDVSR